MLLRGAFKIKSAKTWEMFPSSDDPLPPYPAWDFFLLRNFFKWNNPLQNLGNHFKMGTLKRKSTTICNISVLFAIFKVKKYKFIHLRVLMRTKLMNYFSNLRTFGNLRIVGNVMKLGTVPKLRYFLILKAPLGS